MSADRAHVIATVAAKGVTRLDEPVRLASGAESDAFVDAKAALDEVADLMAAGRAVADRVRSAGVEVDAVGGLTMGADPLTVATAAALGCRWFLVRKAPKERGTRRLVEGTRLGPGDRVLVIDDVITTGGSLLQAAAAAEAAGATVVAASAVVDRGDTAGPVLAAAGITYLPLATYADLALAPVAPPG